MLYTVVRSFNDLNVAKLPGEPIELDNDRAAKLRKLGLIGNYKPPAITETAKQPEKSTTKKVK